MSFIQQFFTSRDNNANAETFVGQEGRLWWDPVTNQIYSSDGNTPGGIPLAGGGGGNGTPGGSNSQVQFNQNGSFGGTANLTIDSTTGALSAVSFVGDGSALTSLTGANVVGQVAFAAVANSVAGANVSGTVANATYADTAGSATTATSATTAGTVTSAAQPNITSVGTLTSVTTTGNLTGGNLYVGGTGIVTGNLQVQGNLIYNNLTNITTANLVFGLANTSVGVSANGAGWVVGNTNQASWLYNYGTSLWNSNIGISAAGNIIGSNITTAGLISATGNVTGNYFFGNGSQLTGIVSSYGNSNVTLLLAAGIGTNISTTGTVVAGNLNVTTAGNNLSVGHVQIYVANNTITTDNGSAVQFGTRINTGNIYATGLVSATSNVNGANLTTPGQVSAFGNITGNYFIGNGSLLTGIAGTYGNANVAAYLASGTDTSNIVTTANIRAGNISAVGSIDLGGAISAVGNITGGNLLTGANVSAFGNVTGGNIITGGVITTVGNVVANYFVGNGAALFAINGSNVTGTVASATTATSATTAGTVTTAAQPNITSVGTLTSITSTGNISTTGNVTGNYYIGNGSLLTGIVATSSYGNANVVANLAALGTNPISTTGNVTAGYFIGNGSTLTSITGANVTGTVASATTATSATTAGTVTTAAQPNITSVGTLSSVSVTGNINTVGTLNINSTTGNYNVLNITGTALAPYGGNQTWQFFTQNIASGGPGSWILFPDSSQQYTAYPGTSSTLSLTGNITGSYFIGNGSTLTSVNGSNITGTVANATYAVSAGSATTAGTVTTAAQPNITSVGTLSSLTVTANVTGGNILTGGLVSAGGNVNSLTGIFRNGDSNPVYSVPQIIFGYNNTTQYPQFIHTRHNAGSGSFNTIELYTSDGTQAGVFPGNAILGLSVSNGAVGVGNTPNPAFTLDVTGNARVTGNTTGGNLLTGGLISSTGNVTGGNLLTGGLVSATGNITSAANIAGGNIIGTHVGNLTGTTASLSGNVTGGNLISINQVITGNGSITQPGFRFAGDVDTGFFLLGDGNLAVTTNAGTRAIFFDSGLNVPGVVSASGNVTGGNLLTGGLISATGNITGGNILGGANVNATTHTGTTVSVTANVTGGNITTVGTVSATGATNATAFAVGNSAVSNVALGYFPTAGTPAEMAIRDYSTVPSTMYFDNSIGNAGQGGQFSFRGGSSFTQWAKIDQYGINLPTRPAFRVYGAGTTNINATNTLTNSNFAVDYNQGSCLNAATGVFTAPVAGLYQINLVARYAGSASTSAILVRKTSGVTDTTQLYVEWAPNSTMFHAGGATVSKLAVGDTLRLIVVSGTVTFDANDTWSVAYVG